MTKPVKVLHLITGLQTGGAEMMLYKLLSASDREAFPAAVVSLMDHGTLGDKIAALGVPVHALNLSSLWTFPQALLALRKTVRAFAPDVLQGWMYHGNLAAQWARFNSRRRIPVVWNIRQSLYDLQYEKRSTAWVIRMGAWLSPWNSKIIYNSHRSAEQHEAVGYRPDKHVIIPNGFDLEQFKPFLSARRELRVELKLSETTLLIGLIARYHPMKDHANFLQAAAQLAKTHSEAHFVLIGRDVDPTNKAMLKQIEALNLSENVHLLGERQDISRVTAALDIASSSSWAEGFPNVIGEGMACGVPCVVTDVGDSAYLVKNTGLVVPSQNPTALAAAWQHLIEMGPEERKVLGVAARQRIETHFSLPAIVAQYEALYDSLVAQK